MDLNVFHLLSHRWHFPGAHRSRPEHCLWEGQFNWAYNTNIITIALNCKRESELCYISGNVGVGHIPSASRVLVAQEMCMCRYGSLKVKNFYPIFFPHLELFQNFSWAWETKYAFLKAFRNSLLWFWYNKYHLTFELTVVTKPRPHRTAV